MGGQEQRAAADDGESSSYPWLFSIIGCNSAASSDGPRFSLTVYSATAAELTSRVLHFLGPSGVCCLWCLSARLPVSSQASSRPLRPPVFPLRQAQSSRASSFGQPQQSILDLLTDHLATNQDQTTQVKSDQGQPSINQSINHSQSHNFNEVPRLNQTYQTRALDLPTPTASVGATPSPVPAFLQLGLASPKQIQPTAASALNRSPFCNPTAPPHELDCV